MRNRPANDTVAADLSHTIGEACKTRDPSEPIRRMTKDAVWRDNDAVHVGRDEIWNALSDKWANALHCTLQRDIESSGAHSVAIRFEAEWQHSVCGRWYRTSGTIRVSLDELGRISTVESRHTVARISVSKRRLAISTSVTTETAR